MLSGPLAILSHFCSQAHYLAGTIRFLAILPVSPDLLIGRPKIKTARAKWCTYRNGSKLTQNQLSIFPITYLHLLTFQAKVPMLVVCTRQVCTLYLILWDSENVLHSIQVNVISQMFLAQVQCTACTAIQNLHCILHMSLQKF